MWMRGWGEIGAGKADREEGCWGKERGPERKNEKDMGGRRDGNCEFGTGGVDRESWRGNSLHIPQFLFLPFGPT